MPAPPNTKLNPADEIDEVDELFLDPRFEVELVCVVVNPRLGLFAWALA